MNYDFRIFETIQMGMVLIGILAVAYSPIARAIGNRILHGKLPPPGPAAVDTGRLDQMSDEVAAIRHHMNETLERLDFAERMLAQQREKPALPGGQ